MWWKIVKIGGKLSYPALFRLFSRTKTVDRTIRSPDSTTAEVGCSAVISIFSGQSRKAMALLFDLADHDRIAALVSSRDCELFPVRREREVIDQVGFEIRYLLS